MINFSVPGSEKPTLSPKIEELDKPNSAKLYLDSLPSGLGVTLGHAIRRNLLFQLKGFAPLSVEISGVPHEFSSIHGVKESVTDIILNIKSIAIRGFGKEEGSIFLNCDSCKPGPIRASHIDCGSDFEIINGDLVICNVDSSASFKMKITIGSGYGYVSASSHSRDKYHLGNSISISSLYSPVLEAKYKSLPSEEFVGKDKLEIELKTNGVISPVSAVSKACEVAMYYFGCFLSVSPQKVHEEAKSSPDVLSSDVESLLDLSSRELSALKRLNIKSMNDLISKSESDFLKIANFGQRSLNQMKCKLEELGLSLALSDKE